MRRCLDLASRAWPACRPNPMVGAVLVHEGKVVSEGWTSAYGEAHAEVNAIKEVSDDVLKSATLYVSLEPCAHYGKTPPCADLIVQKEIPHVVIACRDPFLAVAGKGIDRLQEAGVKVELGVMENEAQALNKRFFTSHIKERPFVVLKWAESQDGFIDSDRESGPPARISGPEASQLVHSWRAEEEAILVGGNTARRDDPSLTTRLVDGPDPKRLVWSRNPLDPSLKLSESGYTRLGSVNVKGLMNEVHGLGIQSVLVEGGRSVLQQFIDEGVYDEIRRIFGSGNLGAGIPAPELSLDPIGTEVVGADVIHYYSGAKI